MIRKVHKWDKFRDAPQALFVDYEAQRKKLYDEYEVEKQELLEEYQEHAARVDEFGLDVHDVFVDLGQVGFEVFKKGFDVRGKEWETMDPAGRRTWVNIAKAMLERFYDQSDKEACDGEDEDKDEGEGEGEGGE